MLKTGGKRSARHAATMPAALFALALLPILFLNVLPGCGTSNAQNSPPKPATELRIGYFANLTHAQALIGIKRGDFQRAIGDVELQTKCFNAGPAAVEAIFAGELDLAYVGPSPALNAFIKSRGNAVRIISGSAANGVAIVATSQSGIKTMEDLRGKKITTPQYGNTQDVSARHYIKNVLKANLVEDGGDTEIFTIANAEGVSLLRLGKLDAAWAPEPWASRMIHEAKAVLVAEEKDLWDDKQFCTVVLLASAKFLKEQPELAQKFLKAHQEVTAWINENPVDAAGIVNEQLKEHLGKGLAKEVLKSAFARVQFTTDPLKKSIREIAERSRQLDFIPEVPDLEPLFWQAPAGDSHP